jgi:mono/diheme cytochrome c family protein
LKRNFGEDQFLNRKHLLWIVLLFLGLVVLAGTMVIFTKKTALPESLTPTSTRTASERLAQPPLPAHPSQYEYGRYLYWLNCMACHGDRGQGLTAEFRSLYVEDQNCWARGCHAGRPGEQGFPIPRTVPAVISATSKLPPFATPEKLFEFLRATHPPQYPGHFPDDQYWAITNYLLVQNHRLSPNQTLGSASQVALANLRRSVAGGLLFLVAVVTIAWLITLRRSKKRGLQPS